METSEEVAKWGEEWLRSWVEDPSVSEHEREMREGRADIWRTLTLEEVMRWWRGADERLIYGGQTAEEFDVNHAAGNHAALYRREGNGLLVWRAYSEYREAGHPVPEAILEKFDEWARSLARAHTAAEVAQAIEMQPEGYGRSAVRHLARVEASRNIVRRVAQMFDLFRHRGRHFKDMEVFRRVGQDVGLSAGAVKKRWERWQAGTQQRVAAKRRAPASVFELGQEPGE